MIEAKQPTTVDIAAALNRIAPPELAEGWDRIGLMIGRDKAKIAGVLTALDPSLEAIQAAVKNNCNCLVTHHPLLFKPISQLKTDSFIGAMIEAAVKADLNLIAAHTNLDSAVGGVNDVLVGLLGLRDVEPLDRAADHPGAGLGRVGDLPRAVPLAELADKVKEVLGISDLKLAGAEDRPINRVALIGGSGGSMIDSARRAGADVLFTGEVGYHQALEAVAEGLALIEAGHGATENPVVEVLARRLKEELDAAGFDCPVKAMTNLPEPLRPY